MKLTTNDGAFQTWNQDSKSLGETNQNGAQPVEIQRLKSQNTTFKSTSFQIKTILRSSILAYVTLLELEFTQPFRPQRPPPITSNQTECGVKLSVL